MTITKLLPSAIQQHMDSITKPKSLSLIGFDRDDRFEW